MNRYLIELVYVLAIDHRAEMRLLNPLASEWTHKPKNTNNNNAPECKDNRSMESAGDIKPS